MRHPGFFVIFVFVLALYGCYTAIPDRRTGKFTPQDFMNEVYEIKALYESPDATDEEIEKKYDELNRNLNSSAYAPDIVKQVLKKWAREMDHIWPKKGLMMHEDFLKGKKFSRERPGLVIVKPIVSFRKEKKVWNVEGVEEPSSWFRLDVFSFICRESFDVPYMAYAIYFAERVDARKSVVRTLRESDRERRNVCFLLDRAETKLIPATREMKEKEKGIIRILDEKGALPGGYAKEMVKKVEEAKFFARTRYTCAIQCSEDIGLYKEFDAPCWSKEVYDYLRKYVYGTATAQ